MLVPRDQQRTRAVRRCPKLIVEPSSGGDLPNLLLEDRRLPDTHTVAGALCVHQAKNLAPFLTGQQTPTMTTPWVNEHREHRVRFAVIMRGIAVGGCQQTDFNAVVFTRKRLKWGLPAMLITVR